MKKIITFILAAVCSVMLSGTIAGCGGNDKVIRINEVTHSVFYAPLYLADSLGYLKKKAMK